MSKIGRDWNAVDAHFRRGGPMKHKNTPRGGAKNESREMVDEALTEEGEEDKEHLENVKQPVSSGTESSGDQGE